MAIQEVPLANLVEDFTLYPRHQVDDNNTASLFAALRAGATLPPLVACEKSMRITDGWHRVRAYRRFLGPDGVVDVDLRTYANDAELFADSVRMNAGHGRKLDRIDQIRAITISRSLGISDKEVAVMLSVPPERLHILSVRVATAPEGANGKAGVVPGTSVLPLKKSASHLAGHELTKEQVSVHASAPGVSYFLLARQLADGLRVRLVNLQDERMHETLLELQHEIDKAIASLQVPIEA